jgi:hypothetical protein
MKIQWNDGAMLFRPTTVREHNALARLHRAMGGEPTSGEFVDLWVSSEYPGEGEAPTGNRLIHETAGTNPVPESDRS